MSGKQKKLLIIGVIFFVIYTFAAARPVPIETILSPKWFISLESNYPTAILDDTSELLPFFLGNRPGGHFGYVDKEGNFTINQVLRANREVSLSPTNWAEYDALPRNIEVRNPLNQRVLQIENVRGYPLFLDNRIFIISNVQNSISEINSEGGILWSYDFASIITTIDAAAGLLLAGLLDGTVEVLNNEGQRVFSFVPGGSRRSIIYGCAISRDGSRIAIVSGIDLQRFLLLERYGTEQGGNIDYRVIFHEFLEEGFRRAVYVSFIDNDSRVIFERQGGLGIYEIRSRTSLRIPLRGEIRNIDEFGSDRLLFLITSEENFQKRLVVVRLPGTIIISAPFKSENSFLGRQASIIYIGGNMTLAAFELEKK